MDLPGEMKNIGPSIASELIIVLGLFRVVSLMSKRYRLEKNGFDVSTPVHEVPMHGNNSLKDIVLMLKNV